jgi:hypothetical protein
MKRISDMRVERLGVAPVVRVQDLDLACELGACARRELDVFGRRGAANQGARPSASSERPEPQLA